MQAAAEALDRMDDGSKERGSVFPCSFASTAAFHTWAWVLC